LFFVTVVGLFVSGGEDSGVVIRVEILRLPVFADKATSFRKVSCEVDMFLAALNFSFEATSGLTPLL